MRVTSLMTYEDNRSVGRPQSSDDGNFGGAAGNLPSLADGTCAPRNLIRLNSLAPVYFLPTVMRRVRVRCMSDVTRILSAIERGDPHAAAQLLPLVYEELRKLAAQKLAQEAPGQTLQATALVHEAYLRLVASDQASGSPELRWDSRGHFFAAAAEAMRRILIDNARRKGCVKRGGARKRIDLDDADLISIAPPDEFLLIDEAIAKLACEDARAAQLVRLRYFAGLSVEEAAEICGFSRSTAYEHWTYARAWLHCELYGP
jgi:RNA polymerase sigma factor (TIGR02999 family)